MDIGHRTASNDPDLLLLMQSIEMVDDQVVGCFRYAQVKKAGYDQMENVIPAVRMIAITSLVILMAF